MDGAEWNSLSLMKSKENNGGGCMKAIIIILFIVVFPAGAFAVSPLFGTGIAICGIALMYSAFLKEDNSGVIPCRTRPQPSNCYNIYITIIESKSTFNYIILIIPLILLLGFGYYFLTKPEYLLD